MSNPFDVLSQFDRLASSVFDTARAPRLMPVDLFREGDQYVLSADLPGIDPASVDLDVDGQLLTIRAERPAPSSENVKWISHERPYGSYMRQFTLGDGSTRRRSPPTTSTGCCPSSCRWPRRPSPARSRSRPPAAAAAR